MEKFLYLRRHGYYLTVDPEDKSKFTLTLQQPPEGLFSTNLTGLLVLTDSGIVPRFKSFWDPPLGVRPKQTSGFNQFSLECEEDEQKTQCKKYLTLWKEHILDEEDNNITSDKFHWTFNQLDAWEVHPYMSQSHFLQDFVSPLLPAISPMLARDLVRLRVKPKLARKGRVHMLGVNGKLIEFSGIKRQALESAIYAALYNC